MKALNQKLLAASAIGDLGSVKKSISEGANINAVDSWQNSALSNAVWGGNIKIMNWLFDHGAQIDLQGTHNLLIHAAFNARLASVQWLLDKGVDPEITIEKTGENALHYTIVKKDNPVRTEIVKLLINAGTDVNKKTIPNSETACFMRDAFLKGETPLHRAAAYGDAEMITSLKNAGGDLSIKDACGDTPIAWGSWHLRPPHILGLLLYGNVPGWHGFPNPNLNGKDLK